MPCLFLCRQVSDEGMLLSEIENIPFSVLQEHCSRERYAQHLARLICFVARAAKEPYDLFPVFLTDFQKELVDFIIQGTDLSTHAPLSQLHADIHTLSLTLFTSRLADNMFDSDPFCRFIIASSLCENGGGFIDPPSLSPLLARSQYLFRAVIAEEIHATGDDSDARFE